MKKGYIIAHDVGTSCDKAVLVDLLGKVAGSVREPYEVYYPAEGFAKPRGLVECDYKIYEEAT